MSEQPVINPAGDESGGPVGPNVDVVTEPETCIFPTGPDDNPDLTQCGRPPETRAPGARGRAPEYCDDPKHTSLKAHRRREKAKKKQAGSPAEDVLTLDPDRPVTDAATAMPVVRTRWSAVLDERQAFLDRSNAELARLLDQAAELAEFMDDPDKASGEIKHIRTTAAAEISAAQTRADKAERAQKKGQQDLDRAIDVRNEAVTELEDLEASTQEQLTQAAADVTTANEEKKRLVAEAEAASKTAINKAAQDLDAAKKAMAEDLARIEKETAKKIAELDQAAATKITAAEQEAAAAIKKAAQDLDAAKKAMAEDLARIEKETAKKIAELDQAAATKVKKAEQEAAAAVHAQSTAEHQLAEARQQAARDATAAQAAGEELKRVRQDMAKLNERLDKAEKKNDNMQTRLDNTETRHVEEMRLLREDHTRERGDWSTARQSAEHAHATQIKALTAQITALTEAATSADTADVEQKGNKK